MGVDVQEVVVVLHKEPLELESGVVVVRDIYLDAHAADQVVALQLLAKEVDVQIARRTVVRLGIVQRQSIALEHHHADAVLVVELGQMAQRSLVRLVQLLHGKGRAHPPQIELEPGIFTDSGSTFTPASTSACRPSSAMAGTCCLVANFFSDPQSSGLSPPKSNPTARGSTFPSATISKESKTPTTPLE